MVSIEIGVNFISTIWQTIKDMAPTITGIVAGVASFLYVLRWLDKRLHPVKIKDKSNNADIAFEVENNTGETIFVAPRNFMVNGRKGKVKLDVSRDPRDILIHLQRGGKIKEFAQRDSLPSDSLYCQFPASTEPTTGRGPWALRLDPEGLDKKKEISTKRKPIYERIVEEKLRDWNRILNANVDIFSKGEELKDKLTPKSLINVREGRTASLELRPYFRLHFIKNEKWRLKELERL